MELNDAIRVFAHDQGETPDFPATQPIFTTFELMAAVAGLTLLVATKPHAESKQLGYARSAREKAASALGMTRAMVDALEIIMASAITRNRMKGNALDHDPRAMQQQPSTFAPLPSTPSPTMRVQPEPPYVVCDD